MSYVTTGASHHRGVANEHKLIKKLREIATELFPQLSTPFVVKHKGGTANKADIEIDDGNQVIKISAKVKTNIKVGSYDHVNTSKALEFDIFEDLKSCAARLDGSGWEKERARKHFNLNSHRTMRRISSAMIKKILVDHVATKNKDMTIILGDEKTGKHYVFDFKDTPLYESIMKDTPVLDWGANRNGNQQTSVKIVFKDSDGTVKDHGLRGRLVLNNGVGALVGTKKNSVPVFKVQQDSVVRALSQIPVEKVQIFT